MSLIVRETPKEPRCIPDGGIGGPFIIGMLSWTKLNIPMACEASQQIERLSIVACPSQRT